MTYLRTSRARFLLVLFLLLSLLFVSFADIDIAVARLFFDHRFYMADRGWTQFLHDSVGVVLVMSLSTLLAIYAFNRIARRDVCGVTGKKVIYLLLVAALGAGVIVNATLKDNFGRVRPRNVEQFGGPGHFTPAFVVANGCKRNCSFSSGDAAGGFFVAVLAMALTRRRALIVAAIGFGFAVSAARIVSGAHFLSDTIVSFFVMMIVADVLHHYLFVVERRPLARAPDPVPSLHSPGLPL